MRTDTVHKNTAGHPGKMDKVTALKPPKNSKTSIKPPSHLKKAGKKLWESVTTSFELEEHDFVLLAAWAETLDRKNQAEKDLRKYGSITFENRHGELKPHPAIAVVRDCNVMMARLRRELCLSEEEPMDSRPPRMKYGGPK
jgi:P27 family predicted phage terminase small subunit